MDERIKRRIAEVEAAERQAEVQLAAIRTVLAELRALLAPAPDRPALSGDPLGAEPAP